MPGSCRLRAVGCASAFWLLLQGAAGAVTLTPVHGGVSVRASDGRALRVMPADIAVRAAGGATTAIWPVTVGRVTRSGSTSIFTLQTHQSVVEIWNLREESLHHEVVLDGTALSALASDDRIHLSWTIQRDGPLPAHRVSTDVSVAAWRRAGSPASWHVAPTAVGLALARLDPGFADPSLPAPAATADCPPDLIAECDGSGNATDEQAWLSSFSGTPDAGCGAVTQSLDVVSGVTQALLSYPDFSDLSTWTLNGRAATMGNPVLDSAGREVLRLTSFFTESGSAFVTNPILLDANSSFSATFSFRISAPGGVGDSDGAGADGLVFAVQAVANTAGGSGGGLGYGGIGTSIGVEFDTYDNGTWDDNDGNHVGIDLDGNIDSVVQAHVPTRMNDGDVWYAWVDYDGLTDTLEARVSLQPVRPAAPDVSWIVDLPATLGGNQAFVGFTSGTGSGFGTHDILSFTLDIQTPDVNCTGFDVQTVTCTETDGCGNAAACTRLMRIVDTKPPLITPLPPVLGCTDYLHAAAGPDGTAVVSPGVDVVDKCGTVTVSNDRTAGGADATDVYPCGLTQVRFDAVDACGNASSCLVAVLVQPGLAPPSVGAALRVHKDASSQAVLDWSLAALPAGTPAAVLASDGRPGLTPFAEPGAVSTWTDPNPTGPIRWFDVRATDCANDLSPD